MCRVFGCVAAEPASIRSELIEADNPLIRQSEDHDSGWGMAVYERADGLDPRCVRFAEAAFSDPDFVEATALRGRIFNVHVRRATMGGLAPENTHPFCLGSYSFGHNGTILRYPRLLEHPTVAQPSGDTDSEAFFNFLMTIYDASDPIGSLRCAIRTAVERSPFSGLNFLFSDGDRLFAYRLGMFELHWLHRARAAAGRLRAGHRRGVAHGPAGRAARARPGRPRAAARRAPDRRRAARAGTGAEGRSPGSPARRGPRRGRRGARSGGSGRHLSRRFALLVNPASAGGKALKALPVVHETLDRLGAAHRTITTRSSEHAAEEATRAAAQGETVAALSGDGLLRPLGSALKGSGAALAIIPCGRGNDLARVLGIPTDPADGHRGRRDRRRSG